MKKWIFTLFATAIFLLAPSAVHAASFPDVNANTEIGRAIDFLADKQIVRGFPDGTFKPYAYVTRGQAAKMIGQLTLTVSSARYQQGITQSSFTDVSVSHEYYSSIQGLHEYNIVNGYADGTFRMNNTVTRAHVAKMLAYSYNLKKPTTQQSFSDVPKTSPRYAYINAVYVANIMPYRTFSPDKRVTRGEMALFLFRAYNQATNDLQASTALQPFIGTQTTIGKAYAEHEFMDEAIRRNMPIAAARQSVRNYHFYAGYELPYPCSMFMEEGFSLCYEDGMSNGKNGINRVVLYDEQMENPKLKGRVLVQALGERSLSIKTYNYDGAIWYIGHTKQAINGVYYGFMASAGQSTNPLSFSAAHLTHLSVSVNPLEQLY